MNSNVFTALLALYLAITVLRVWSLIRSNIWIWQHGSEFRLERSALSDAEKRSPQKQWELYDKYKANFFPFGDKSYRLQRFAYGGHTRMARMVRRPFLVLRRVWWWPGFVVLTYVFLILISQWPRQSLFGSAQIGLVVTICVVLIVGTVLVGAEGVLSTRLMDSTWAAQYQRFDPDPKVPEKAAIAETAGFIATAILAWLAAAGTMYFLATRNNGYSKLGAGQGIALRIVGALHYAWTTLIMFTDADPTNTTSTLITYLLEFQGGAFVLVVLAHIGGAVSPPDRSNEIAVTNAPAVQIVTPTTSQKLTRLFGPGVVLVVGLIWRFLAHRG